MYSVDTLWSYCIFDLFIHTLDQGNIIPEVEVLRTAYLG